MVSDDASDRPGPFDLNTLKVLASLMSRHDLSELDLSDGQRRIRLRRGPRQVAAPLAALPAAPAAPTSSPPAAPAAASAASAPEKPARQLLEIKSSMVGTFYNREKPEAAPYVSIGSRVGPRTIVGQLEAMKLFNEVYAECSGVIAEILADNAQFVEYGTVLFRVDPAG
jgi:acetyl-CoA carboxylase biotin carboxyl carrier protein